MAIAFAAGPPPTITVTGFSAVTPCRWLDIWNADQGGGWGVVTKVSDDMYYCAARLHIGTDANTWMYQEEEQVELNAGANSSSEYLRVKGHYTFGKDASVDGADYNNIGGSLSIRDGAASAFPILTYAGSTTKMYGTRLNVESTGNIGFNGTGDEIKNSIISGNSSFLIGSASTLTAKDVQVFTTNIFFDANPTSFDGIRYFGTLNNRGFYIQSNNKTIEASNVEVNDPTSNKPFYFYLFGTNGILFINDSTGPAVYYIRVAGSECWDRKSWSPTVVDSNGNALQAVLSLDDGKGNTIYTGTANASGQYDFSGIDTTYGSGYNASDTTMARLVWRNFSYSGTPASPTIDTTYKTHIGTFTLAGYIPKTITFDMDVTRKNDIVVMQAKSFIDKGNLEVVDLSDKTEVVDVRDPISVVSL